MIQEMMIGALTLVASLAAAEPIAPQVYFQSHRGGLEEVPENTLPARG